MSAVVPPTGSYAALHAALGVEVPEELLAQALTHRSFAYEQGGLPTNERLEFLGDAVLGLVVTDLLYRRSPELPEGQLAPLRASVVSSRALAGLARRLGLGQWLRLGKGELSTGGRDKSTILADTLEAVIGAVYLAHGVEAASTMVLAMVEPELRAVERRGGAVDWKTALQELAAARGTAPPSYVVTDSGPDHAKHFTAHVHLDGVAQGTGEGPTKKEAEQEAAREAVTVLEAATVLPGDAAPGTPAAD